MYLNFSKYVTVQKLDRHFWVSCFAAALKTDVFDGTNYKRWHAKCILWVPTMHVSCCQKLTCWTTYSKGGTCVLRE